MNTISFESWCETQPCSKMPCANHKACRKGWQGALQMVIHNDVPGQVFYMGEREIGGATGIPGMHRKFMMQPDIPYESFLKREQRDIDRFIEDNEDLVTHEAMIDLYANRLRPKWYHHWLFWVIITALVSGVAITIWGVMK